MADVNPRVMEMVETEIKKNPEIGTDALREKAKKIDKGVSKLSNRQFNARYPLQVKRRLANTSGRPRRRRARRRPSVRRMNTDAMRGVMLEFAKDLASADGKAAMVDVIGNVDQYVDRLAKAAAKR